MSEASAEPLRALLLYTGYYKNTLFVGPVILRHGHEPVFWKAFRGTKELELELRRVEGVRVLIGGSLRMANGHHVGAEVIQYQHLPRSKRRLSEATLAQVAIEMGWRAQSAAVTRETFGVDPAVVLDAARVREFADVTGILDPTVVDDLLTDLPRCLAAELYLSHGDFTGRNVFSLYGGGVGVVDYDAVGMRPAFFDVVHLVCQSSVDAGRQPPVAELQGLLASVVGASRAREHLRLCLFWDWYENMLQYLDHPENRGRTGAAVALRLAAWRQCRE
ncbi:phosphotransferase [Blastococcus deserti]|uniref:Phosphotransferase n=1 Tax=Blastococcus deserti TaxID=2259033 RepID=A0ABW4XE73_9ACTN